MKDFLKFTLATLVGIILAGIVLFFLGITTIFGIASSSDSETIVKDNSVMVLNLNGTLAERSQDDMTTMLNNLYNSDIQSYGLEDILASIKKAKENEKIKGIYIKANYLQTSYASLEAIRRSLEDFKTSGKFVVAYADNYTQGLYYISSVADKVMLNPYGSVQWKGLSSTLLFFKDLLDNLGVEMQIFKVGTYKSAVEPYINTQMSEANREQMNAFLHSTWNQVLKGVSTSRNISIDKLNQLADEMLELQPAKRSLKSGLVDTLIYQNNVKAYLKTLVGIDDEDTLPTLSLKDMINVKKNTPKDISGKMVAVYYACGEIRDVPTTGGTEEIIGNKVIKDLYKLKENDDIKAVVLRVNSPGGSAFASEQIWHAVKELKGKKPVIVSMGDYAASGGYYISCNADTIVAENTTLTGSIGIFGMIPNAEKLTKKIGLSFDVAKTNQYADFGMNGKGFNAGEKILLQNMIEEGYHTFTSRCADGRNMTLDAIHKIAEGRVWTGEKAKEIGLVDVIGGIDTAIEIAARKAGITNYTLVSYPKKESLFDIIFSSNSFETILQKNLNNQLGEYYQTFKWINNIDQTSTIQARMPFDFEIN